MPTVTTSCDIRNLRADEGLAAPSGPPYDLRMPSDADVRAKGVSYSNVLVPLDGSKRARAALPTARALAAAFDAELHTIKVVHDFAGLDRSGLAERPLDPLGRRERSIVRIGGDPAAAIHERAQELGGSLICVSTRARGRLGRAVFGSVAAAVVQGSCPTVVVGPVAERPLWSPPSRSWPPPLSSPRIVAYVDGSHASESVLPMAAQWARALDKQLTILAIADDVPPQVRGTGRDRRFAPHATAEEYVEHLATTWSAHVPQVRGAVRRDPIGPASGVRAHLRASPAALVVVGTQLRSGFRAEGRAVDSARIVRVSTAPCLVVPASSVPFRTGWS